jgi:hypothetical protein
MKKIITILTLLTLACGFSAKAQDFIVTHGRDSLNCKLGKLEGDQYLVTYYRNNEKVDGEIHKDSIFVIHKKMFRSLSNNRIRPWYSVVDFSIDAGATHQTGPFRMDDDLTDKSEFAAKTGIYANAGFVYYWNKTFGFGLKYDHRRLLEGNLNYNYVAPMISVRLWEKSRKSHAFFNASAGYGFMRQKNAPIQYYEQRPRVGMRSEEMAFDIAAGYSVKLSWAVSMFAKVSYYIGKSRHINIDDLRTTVNANTIAPEIDGYLDNMNTVNLSLGFTFHGGSRR